MTETGMEDIRSRLVSVEHIASGNSLKIGDLGTRMAALESWKSGKDVSDAKDGVVLDNLTKSVEKLHAGIGKVFWTIIIAIVTAFIMFVIQGGLAKAQEATTAFFMPTPKTQMASEKGCPAQKPVFVHAYCRAEPFSKIMALRD